jgi:DNA-binding NtrC family response regulator
MGKPIPEIPCEVVQALSAYHFPGNVRELRNMTERAIIFCKGNKLSVDDFILKSQSVSAVFQAPVVASPVDCESDMIRERLKSCGFNQTETAASLGITRDALIRKMKKYNISVARTGV